MLKSPSIQLSLTNSDTDIPLWLRTYIILKKAIISGDLPRNTRLPEKLVAEAFNISTTPIREAFRHLENENLIIICPWRGAEVYGLTNEDILSLYNCREVLAGLSVRLFTQNATEEDISTLESIYNDWCNIKDRDDQTLHIAFHTYILKVANNFSLTSFLFRYIDLFKTDILLNSQTKLRLRSCKRELYAILLKIKKHEPYKAENAMKKHIQNSYKYRFNRHALLTKQASENKNKHNFTQTELSSKLKELSDNYFHEISGTNDQFNHFKYLY